MPQAPLPRRPDDTHRSVIIGQNGQGKTGAGVYQLAWRSYARMPWLMFNYKGDEYLDAIPGYKELALNADIPKEAGLYMVRPPPIPYSIDHMLMKILQRRNVGLYIDEGLNVGEHSKPLRVLLTQGRSLHLPVIFLTQRPVLLGKFPLTETNFFQVFYLQAQSDRKIMTEYLPVDVNDIATLGEYESYYYDSGTKRRLAKLGPVPFGDEVLDIFDRRRPRRLKSIK